ncbi:MAG: 50S ribosomal protein L4, partial [bacterium]
EMANVLDNFEVANDKVIFLTSEVDEMLMRAGGNIPYLKIMRADFASTHDLLSSNRLFIQKSAIAKLEEVLS